MSELEEGQKGIGFFEEGIGFFSNKNRIFSVTDFFWRAVHARAFFLPHLNALVILMRQ